MTPADVKGLFFHLVAATGGVESAGRFLGISHQRVSQLQNPTCADMPTLMQVVTLEGVVEQAIVTGALARAASGIDPGDDALKEAGDVMVAAPRVFELIRGGAEKKAVKSAVIELRREVDELERSVDREAG